MPFIQALQQLEHHAISFITSLLCVFCRLRYTIPSLSQVGGESPPCSDVPGFSKPFPEQIPAVSLSPHSRLFSLLAKLDARKERGVLMIWIMQLSGWSMAGCLLPFLSFSPSQLGSGMTGIPARRELARTPIYENQVPGHGLWGEQEQCSATGHHCLRTGSSLVLS